MSAFGLAAYGNTHWAGVTHTLLDQLQAPRQPPTVTQFDAHELDRLPPPVQRYFRAVLKDGQPSSAQLLWSTQARSTCRWNASS